MKDLRTRLQNSTLYPDNSSCTMNKDPVRLSYPHRKNTGRTHSLWKDQFLQNLVVLQVDLTGSSDKWYIWQSNLHRAWYATLKRQPHTYWRVHFQCLASYYQWQTAGHHGLISMYHTLLHATPSTNLYCRVHFALLLQGVRLRNV